MFYKDKNMFGDDKEVANLYLLSVYHVYIMVSYLIMIVLMKHLRVTLILSSMSTILNNSINSCINKSGYTINDCVLNSLVSKWYVDVRLDSTILVQEDIL